jgi:hypothetical protein
MGRLLPAGSIIRDQLDFFFPLGSIIRVTGMTIASLSNVVFVNNSPLAWPLQDGSLVPDVSIVAGAIYFNELAGNPGYYAIRFFPDRVGFWRITFTNSGIGTEIIKEYDVVPAGTFTPGLSGLNAQFTRQ